METVPSSFRDPHGFLFIKDHTVFRQINSSYAPHYDHLISSGLFKNLTDNHYLIPHKEVDNSLAPSKKTAYKVIEPQQISLISYPYEWSFGMLKDAALLTLRIQEIALSYGMSLKDASGYNIQFIGATPCFIDTLSLEKIDEKLKPWTAYNQFCRHFLAPLLLMTHSDLRLISLLKNYIDGIPLDLASKLLPLKSHLKGGPLVHIHMHSKMIGRYSDKKDGSSKEMKTTMNSLKGILDSLKSSITNLKLSSLKTEWGSYYEETNYSDASFKKKEEMVSLLLDQIGVAGNKVLDLGANTGVFSDLAAKKAAYVISADVDPVAVEKNYQRQKNVGGQNIHPLMIDLTNPSPAIGWNNSERETFYNRCDAKVVMALALIHHLAISNNLPLSKIASFFAELAPFLIIEFVPKSDSQVQRLLQSREDIFPDYNAAGFERSFKNLFNIIKQEPLEGTERTLYLLERKGK